jgi:NADH:ubiquinone oxidoreductase subunit 6 (subunit J)
MSAVFIVIAALTLASAIAAMSLRNLVHCALLAALTFAGLAALFLQLHAQFVGLAQILVYVGAVAILIVFAILLTRGSEPSPAAIFSRSWRTGVVIAALVWISLTAAILLSPVSRVTAPAKANVGSDVAVQQIGTRLMTDYVLPLEIVALLLTAAAIGAVIIAMDEKGVKA